jgi:hypothetical protein
MAMGVGVRMRKRRKAGVMVSRLAASAKNAKTVSMRLGTSWVRSSR